jgi:hypothetical protein
MVEKKELGVGEKRSAAKAAIQHILPDQPKLESEQQPKPISVKTQFQTLIDNIHITYIAPLDRLGKKKNKDKNLERTRLARNIFNDFQSGIKEIMDSIIEDE